MIVSKATRTAIAAMSRLAEVYDGGATRISASQIARDRGLKKPFVSKVLSELSRAGLVEGSTGPGGGFTLTRPPAEITVSEVMKLFGRAEAMAQCPFGGGRCGEGEPCPLHDTYLKAKESMLRFYEETTFDVFRKA
jgi:Rrf2 family protein